MVNAQELQGSWNRLKGQVKERWGSLTDDDLQMHGGNLDQLVGKIQQRTGETREAIENFLNSLSERTASGLSQVTETAAKYAQKASDQVRERYQYAADQLSEGYENVERAMREHPTRSVAAAFGVGLGLGLLVGLALRSR
jgi:uncharacterized protein YjbJ (UPF0337 family)